MINGLHWIEHFDSNSTDCRYLPHQLHFDSEIVPYLLLQIICNRFHVPQMCYCKAPYNEFS